MILFPAIDLKDGKCVRLQQGDMKRVTLYNDDPLDQAKMFEEQGFKWLHIVDLDGAVEGNQKNGGVIREIVQKTNMSVQIGGGIRSMNQIEEWMKYGVTRVILGTAATNNPNLVREASIFFRGMVAVGIDVKDGLVAVDGWTKKSTITAIELAQRFEAVGVNAIIYTDIKRDGMLKGINWETTLELAHSVNIPVIASGGLAGMDDIIYMTKPEARILEGAICGRALYDGKINPQDAINMLRNTHTSGKTK